MTTDGPVEDSADTAIDEPGAPPRHRRRVVALIVLALIAVVAVASAVVQTRERADLEAAVDDRADAADVASRFAERLLSYDHDDLDAQAEGIEALATVDFADEFRDALDTGLGASIRELEATSTATVNEVLSAEVTGGRARVIAIVDSEISSDAGTRAAIDTYLDIELRYLDGRWQVDDVQTIANQGGTPTTTTTTTPAG